MIERMAILVVLAVISSESEAESGEPVPAPQSGYSVDTLMQPIFDTAEVAVETARLNNWLNDNYEGLSSDQYKGPREFLYYLIDSHVKDIYAREGQILPEEPDLILQTLFSWAERLGVYGGSNVFNEIRLPSESERPVTLDPPASMSISMHGDLLRIESKSKSWAFDVPYYFMPFLLTEFTATNGMPVQFLIISTGASKDNSDAGRSQATLMLIYSSDVDFAEFNSFWTDQIGIPEDSIVSKLEFKNLPVNYYYDASAMLHTEALISKAESGAFAMTYGGIDGSYQWNRQHFQDFLHSLHRPFETARPSLSVIHAS